MTRSTGSTTTGAPRWWNGRARLVAIGLAVTTMVVTAAGVGAVQAAPPAEDPTTAAGYGARWAAAQFDPAGYVPNALGDPNVSATIQDALALAAAGVEEATFDQAMTWLQANVDTIVDGGGTGDDPARLGYLMLLADAAGIDPTSFGGADLPALLLATLGTLEPGLFGGADPTYDGAFRQSLAIVGLVASGTAVPGAATAWLVDQQCDAMNPAADGGWQAYRSDTTLPCDAPDPITYTGPDTNSTAMALQALAADGLLSGADDALDFLERAQAPDGGFPYVEGGATDPNSTALVILGIVAGGEDPAVGRWVGGTESPVASLLSWQIGCDAEPADQGAFASPFSSGSPDPIATSQAIWGAAAQPFPLDGPVAFAAAPIPCEAPTTTTTNEVTPPTTTVVGGAAIPATPATFAPSTVASPVAAQPRLAG